MQGDELTDRFFRIMTNLAVTHSLSSEIAGPRTAQLSYLALDGYVKLIVLLINRKPFGSATGWRLRKAYLLCLMQNLLL